MPEARTTHVVAADRDQAFSTISEALVAAADGDLIQIHPGVYREALTIAKEVVLAGVGPHEDIKITAEREPVVTSFGKIVTLKNLTLVSKSRTQPAVICKEGNLDLQFSSVEGGKYAVAADLGARLAVSNCSISDAERGGIVAKGCRNVLVDDTLVERCGGSGLIAESCDEVRVAHSSFHDTTPHAIECSGEGLFEVVDAEFTAVSHAQILDNLRPVKFDTERAWYTRRQPTAEE